jgi:hypothetical protein
MSSTAVATNKVHPTAHAHVRTHGAVTVNGDIPLAAGIEPWRMTAIQKVIGFGGLAPNWDGRGSKAPSLGVRQIAIDFLLRVPSLGTPRVVPTSGGGYHFEWSVGQRELEVSIDAAGAFEALRVENGVPLEDEPRAALPALLAWLISK